MPSFMMIFALPLVFLNWFAPIVAVIWLLYLGDFQILIMALVASFASSFGYAIGMLPAMVILLPGIFLIEKSSPLVKAVGMILLAIGGLWTYALMGLWTLFVFGYSPEVAIDRSIPYVLLAYSVSTAAFSYMASKETNAHWGTHYATLLNQLSSMVLCLMLLFSDFSISTMVIVFTGLVIIGYIIGLFGGLLDQIRQPKPTE